MRTIVKIDTTPRSASGSATRYASERDRNPKRELSNSRALFTPDHDGLKWMATDSYLTGRPGARPRSSDLQHIIFSFDKQDARDLEALDPEDRDRGSRLATRAGMKKILDRLKVRDSRWAAVVHRHTKHTHVHVLLSKLAEDSETGKIKRISRFPREMLNSRDPRTGKGRDGLINLDMAEAIDHLLGREKKMDSADRDSPAATFSSTRPQTARISSTLTPPERAGDRPAEKNFSPSNSSPVIRPEMRGAAPGTTSQPPPAQEPQARSTARYDLLSHLRPPAEERATSPATTRPQEAPTLTTTPALYQKVGNPGQSLTQNLVNPGESTLTRETASDAQRFADQPATRHPDSAELPSRSDSPYISPHPTDDPTLDQPDTQPSPDRDDFIDIDF